MACFLRCKVILGMAGFEEFESIYIVGQGLGHSERPKVTKVCQGLKKKRIGERNIILVTIYDKSETESISDNEIKQIIRNNPL